MKKMRVLAVVAVAVLVAASVAKAGELLNFDGQGNSGFRAVSFADMVSGVEIEVAAVPDPVEPVVATEPGNDASSQRRVVAEKLDTIIVLSIESSKNSVPPFARESLKKLLAQGTMEEKLSFVSGNQKKYTFPARIAQGLAVENNDIGSDFHRISKGIPACVSWGSKEVCVDRQVCKDVCVAGAVTCYAVTSVTGVATTVCGPGAAVCTLACIIKPECTSVPVCLEMGEVPGYGSGTPL